MRELACEENWLNGVEEDKDKLDELDGCDVFLPPEIFLNSRPEGRTHVVEIHHGVNTF